MASTSRRLKTPLHGSSKIVADASIVQLDCPIHIFLTTSKVLAEINPLTNACLEKSKTRNKRRNEGMQIIYLHCKWY